MLIKNIGHKIVHIGSVMILPDQTGRISGEMTAPLHTLIERGALEIVTAAPAKTEAPGTPADVGGGKEDGGKGSGKKKQPAE